MRALLLYLSWALPTSRIRVLNLPNSLTDGEVRKHFSTNLPPNAPRDMTITDVFIKKDRYAPPSVRVQ